MFVVFCREGMTGASRWYFGGVEQGMAVDGRGRLAVQNALRLCLKDQEVGALTVVGRGVVRSWRRSGGSGKGFGSSLSDETNELDEASHLH